MAPCDLEQLQNYFKRYGWVCKTDGSSQCSSGWMSDNRVFPLKVTLNPTVLLFEVELLKLERIYAGRSGSEFFRFLFDLNSRSTLIKVTLNDDKVVGLSIGALAEGFSFDHLYQILGILGHYADLIVDEVQTKANELERRRSLLKSLV